MSTALVSGATDRTGPVASALRTEGFETLTLDGGSVEAVPLGRGSVNCYVQLPGLLPAGGANPPALVSRIDDVAAVSPYLADHGHLRAAAVLQQLLHPPGHFGHVQRDRRRMSPRL